MKDELPAIAKTAQRVRVVLEESVNRFNRQHRYTVGVDLRNAARDVVRCTLGFKALWQRWMGRALKRGVLKQRFTFHDLRAKCVSDNKSIEAAMQLAGHTNMAMTRRVYDRGVREVDPLE